MQVRVRDHQCSYDFSGSGPKLTLLHSIGLSTRDGWREQTPVLEKSFSVLSHDFRGLGNSEKGTEPLGVDTFVRDLKDLLNSLNHFPTTLMGVSLGGFVAQQFALTYPDLVSALVLVSTACRIHPGNEARRQERNRRIRASGMGAAVDHQITSHFPPEFLKRNPQIADWYRSHYLANNPESYINVMEDLGRFDCCEALNRIACPVLIVAGDKDTTSVAGREPLESALVLHERIPSSELAVINGANHYPQIDHAKEFNSIVLQFLEKGI